MSQAVLKTLKQIEQQHDIKILLAVEAGSRAYGFEAPNSDYDVRFFYINPLDWYLRIEPTKPVECEIRYKTELEGIEMDIVGFEIKRALLLLRDSNPPLLEYLQTNVVYFEVEMMKELRDICNTHYSREKLAHHCISIARRNWVDYIRNKYFVNRKKYLYILQNLLSCKYLKQHPDLKGLPTINFEEILQSIEIPEKYKNDLEYLLQRKKKEAGQWEKEVQMKNLDEWIQILKKEGEEYAKYLTKNCKKDPIDYKILDPFFLKLIKSYDQLPNL